MDSRKIEQILGAAQQWADAFNRGDAAGCAAMYEPDARMLPAPFDEVQGRAAIEAFWTKMIADGLSNVRYLDPLVEVAADETMHLSSPWAMNAARGMIHKEVWKRQENGQWLLRNDHFEVLDQLPRLEGPSELVLVHGAWMGGWCWDAVIVELETLGIKAVSLDLPGHGERRNEPPPEALGAYTENVIHALEQRSVPAVLVGHSFGGVVTSQVAEERPELVRESVYVSGFMLPDKASFLSATEGAVGSQALDNLVFSDDKRFVGIADAMIHEAVGHDVPAEAFAAAVPNLVLEPCGPLGTPLQLSAARFGRVPRTYVECTKDRALPIEIQRAMRNAIPVETVYSLDSSHSPMFSQPKALATYLAKVANK